MTGHSANPPWKIRDIGSAFIVEDAIGHRLAYVYCDDETGRFSSARLMTRDEARSLAEGIVKLPDLLAAQTK